MIPRQTDESATDNQKARLRSFGVAFHPAISKDEASDIIGKCYESHAPTTEQLQKLKRLGASDRLPPNATMGDARGLLRDVETDPPTKEQISKLTGAGFKVVKSQDMTAGDLDYWLALEDKPSDSNDLETIRHYGLKFAGDAFAAAVLTSLIEQLQDLVEFVDEEERRQITRACIVAMRDPEYPNITFRADKLGLGITPTWPKSKVREWFRKGK